MSYKINRFLLKCVYNDSIGYISFSIAVLTATYFGLIRYRDYYSFETIVSIYMIGMVPMACREAIILYLKFKKHPIKEKPFDDAKRGMAILFVWAVIIVFFLPKN